MEKKLCLKQPYMSTLVYHWFGISNFSATNLLWMLGTCLKDLQIIYGDDHALIHKKIFEASKAMKSTLNNYILTFKDIVGL